MRKHISILLAPVLAVAALVAAPVGNALADTGPFVISPTSLDFGHEVLGAKSARLSVTVRNVSSAPVVMDGSGGGTSSPFSSSNACQGKTVLVNATCQMYFQYAPTALGTTTGSTTGIWNGQSYTINLTGFGEPRFRISPTSFDFGDVTFGTAGPTQRVTIKNLGGPVVMSGAGGGAGQFGGTQDCQGLTIGTGKSCHMYYRFKPTDLGPATGTTSGNWNGQIFSFDFTGNAVPPPDGDFIPVPSTRVLDTRTSTLPTANQQLVIGAAGFGPAPQSAVALDLDITALPAGRAGTLTVWPCGSPMPALPTLRFQAKTAITSHVLATFSPSGLTCLQATQITNVVVDMDGYYASESSFHPLPPQRVERASGASRPRAGKVVRITVTGGSVPAGATAVALNLTALREAHAGHLTAYPCGRKAPNTSALQFQAHRAQSALVVSRIGTAGRVCVRTSAGTNVDADLTGYYMAPSLFTAIRPAHVLNTASHLHYSGPRPKAGQVVRATVTGGAVPGTASAVVVDVTASSEAKAGRAIVYSCKQAEPATMGMQFQRNTPVTNLSVSRVISGSKVCIRPTKGTNLSLDVVGWYA